MTFDWTPKRGDATKAFGSLFDRFYDANQLGIADGTSLATLDPAFEFMADSSGNGGALDAATLSSCTMRSPSTQFGSNNDGLTVTNQLGLVVGHENVESDSVQVSASIRPLVQPTVSEQKVTFVAVARWTAAPLPGVMAYTYAGAPDLDAHLFGIYSGNWTTGSGNNPADSGIVADSDPHLFIAESGTATSSVEVDGVAGANTDLSGISIGIPDTWAILGTGEYLFVGVLVGLLNDFQKQDIRDWVNNNVSTITVA